MNDQSLHDPKGLIRESFNIDGIAAPECRSIFLDWALGVPAGQDTQDLLRALIAHYEGRVGPDHPMMQTMREGLAPSAGPRRRGGRSARIGDDG